MAQLTTSIQVWDRKTLMFASQSSSAALFASELQKLSKAGFINFFPMKMQQIPLDTQPDS